MPVVSVSEFGRVYCGCSCIPNDRILSRSQFATLERLCDELEESRGIRPFLSGPRATLVAQNFVGVLDLGSVQIEVLPKIDAHAPKVRQNLIRMLAAVDELQVFAESESASLSSADTLLEHFIRLYCSALWRLMRRGLIRRYEKNSDALTVLRGRIDIAEQMRRHSSHPERVYCTFEEFSADNLFNQILRLALRVLLRRSTSQVSSAALAELLFCFEGISDIPATSIKWEHVVVDRLTAPWSWVLQLARRFIEGDLPGTSAGSSAGFALLFDMNVLFERYVGAIARRFLPRLGYAVSLQGPARFLATDESGMPCFALYPDIIASRRDNATLVIDTKWKRLESAGLRERISAADVYQMHAYASRYSAGRVVLLYPHHAGLGTWTAERSAFTLMASPNERPSVLAVATVDLSDLSQVGSQLLELAGYRDEAAQSLIEKRSRGFAVA